MQTDERHRTLLRLLTLEENESAISQHYDILGKVFRLTTPPWPELRHIVDKWLLYELASELRIPRRGPASRKLAKSYWGFVDYSLSF